MTNASHDNNNNPTALAVANSNGTTIVPIQVDASMHGLEVDDNTTGSDSGRTPAVRDQNSEPVLMGVSSADGTTLVEIYALVSGGKLLINSN